MKLPAYVTGFCCLFAACTSNEIGNSKDVNPQSVFIDYSVVGTEDDDSVTCLAQFRFAGENGTTLILNAPSSILLDGTTVPVDSNDIMGAYYEKKFKTVSFTGAHLWKYVDGELNNYPASFTFAPFHLEKQLPGFLSRQDSLFIELSGLQDETMITTALSDTSSKTEDVILKRKTEKGKLIIPASAWQNLSSGPLSVQISSTVDTSLSISERPAEGGRLHINYSLNKRGINLKDNAPDITSKF